MMKYKLTALLLALAVSATLLSTAIQAEDQVTVASARPVCTEMPEDCRAEVPSLIFGG